MSFNTRLSSIWSQAKKHPKEVILGIVLALPAFQGLGRTVSHDITEVNEKGLSSWGDPRKLPAKMSNLLNNMGEAYGEDAARIVKSVRTGYGRVMNEGPSGPQP